MVLTAAKKLVLRELKAKHVPLVVTEADVTTESFRRALQDGLTLGTRWLQNPSKFLINHGGMECYVFVMSTKAEVMRRADRPVPVCGRQSAEDPAEKPELVVASEECHETVQTAVECPA